MGGNQTGEVEGPVHGQPELKFKIINQRGRIWPHPRLFKVVTIFKEIIICLVRCSQRTVLGIEASYVGDGSL
ncbi:MAG: hypothetical protein Q9M97_06795, partial [Candidatus Gracilibacteria bacterium]|nr:hypothetical protein [Candidatus Gracilibacteria bacterium]